MNGNWGDDKASDRISRVNMIKRDENSKENKENITEKDNNK